jgi:hypothetical protein
MKSATQLAMFGTGILVIVRLFFILTSVLKLSLLSPEIYTALNTVELLATVAIFNFFYVLFQKQNNKSDKDE